jgi:hypothetical protein
MKLYHIIPLLFLLNCDKPATTHERYQNNMMYMQYIKDTQTNLCFAFYNGSRGPTNVPCTPEVEKVISQQTADAAKIK